MNTNKIKPIIVLEILLLAVLLGSVAGMLSAPAPAPAPAPILTPYDRQVLATLTPGNNAFAVQCFQRLTAKQEGNIFFSPFSIRTVLAMVYAGARNNTATEFRTALHFPDNDTKLHNTFHDALNCLDTGRVARPYELRVANSLWAQKDCDFLEPFLTTCRDSYNGNLRFADFKNAAEAARANINTWVEEKTSNHIRDLIPAGGLDSFSRLVLVNAVYFLGNWEIAFDRSLTRDQKFYLDPARTTLVPMMRHQTEHVEQKPKFRHFHAETFQALELPYKGKDIAMVILLPDEINGLAALEQELTAKNLTLWLRQLRTAREIEIPVILPRWRMTWGTIDLGPAGNELLPGLGLRDAFNQDRADFSGMNGQSPGSPEALFLANVFHQAFIRVDEKGTQAAAATAAMKLLRSAKPLHPLLFRADHPFLYFILERSSGLVLFMGRVVKPE